MKVLIAEQPDVAEVYKLSLQIQNHEVVIIEDGWFCLARSGHQQSICNND